MSSSPDSSTERPPGLVAALALVVAASLAGCASSTPAPPPRTASAPAAATIAAPPTSASPAPAASGAQAPRRPAAGRSSAAAPAQVPAPTPGVVAPTGSPPGGGVLAGKRVAIDPGHNGGNATAPAVINRLVPAGGFRKPCDTTGTATLGGYTEARFNLDVAQRLASILRREGARVVLTRTTNTGVGPCVNVRAAIGNRAHADAAISIHADSFAASGHGFHVIEPALVPGYTERIVAPSARLGRIVRDQMALKSGLAPSNYLGHNGIDVRRDLGGLNLSTVPKVFLENGNMQNRHDAALQTDPRWRERLARVIAAALTQYLTGRR